MSVVAPQPPRRALPALLRSPWTLLGAALLATAGLMQLPWRAADAWPGAAGVGSGDLTERVGSAFVAFWTAGTAGAPALADFSRVSAYWQVFHVTKAVAAAALLALLVLLGVRLWQAFARSTRPGARWMLGTLGVLGAPFAPFVLVVLLANVQGAVAPLSSVLTFLPTDGSDPAVSQAVAQALDGLRSGTLSPALAALVDDFRTYHAVMAWAAIAASIAVIATSVVLLVARARLPRDQRSARRVLVAVALIIPSIAFALGVVALANISTVEDTVPALTAFFEGGGL